jgi:hypothetical protein
MAAAAGPASGGERALVASVPLFAAASAYYKSAGNPNAPRGSSRWTRPSPGSTTTASSEIAVPRRAGWPRP